MAPTHYLLLITIVSIVMAGLFFIIGYRSTDSGAKINPNRDSNWASRKVKAALNKTKTERSKLIQSEKMSSLGVLTAGIAHELNNPVNFSIAIINPLERNFSNLLIAFNDLIELDPELTHEERIEAINEIKDEIEWELLKSETKESLAGLREGLKRIEGIVKDLSSFLRVEENVIKKLNVCQGIDLSLKLLSRMLCNHIKVIKDYQPVPEIDCYPGKLNQVFMNILTNAALSITGPGEIYITVNAVEDNVVIRIKDTGRGIKAENLSKIFEPFFTTREPGQGTGLGLYISYEIVTELAGNIEVVSIDGHGSEFIITIPVSYHCSNRS